MPNPSSHQIITFYSYKGGTGRTMALANLACLLARSDSARGQVAPLRVLAIDWDFEAPGLHRYLQPYLEQESEKRFSEAPGCLELFECLDSERSTYDPKDFVGNRQRARHTLDGLDLERYLLSTRFPGLLLMKAGRFDDDYPRRVAQFDWDELFRSTIGLFAGVADFLRMRFDYVMVDSRTGITDTSGICTMLLPDKLVVVFTPNQQSLTGVESLVRKAVAYRKGSPDGRSLTVFPLPSRVEMARPQLLDAWRNGGDSDPATAALLPAEMSGYQPTFERLFAQIYGRPEIRLGEYFNEVMLQHIPDYAYGEPVPVALETSDSRISLSRSYEAFLDRLIELDVPWISLKTARLEREIVRRCEAIAGKLSEGALEEAIKLAFTLMECKPPDSQSERAARTILDVARAAYPRNREAASAMIGQGIQLTLRKSDVDPAILGEMLLEAGKLTQEFADLQLAEKLLRDSSKQLSGCFGEEHPATLAAKSQLASVLYDLDKVADSRRLNERVLDIRRRVLGDEHPDTLTSMSNLALTLWAQGELEGARMLQEQVLYGRREFLGERHPDTLATMANLGEMLSTQGELEGAERLQEEVLEGCREVLGDRHPATLDSMAKLAETLWAQNDLASARRLQEEVLGGYREVFGEQHPETLESMAKLAKTLRDQGDVAGARLLQEQLLVEFEKTGDLLGRIESMNNLALTLWAQGDLKGVRRLQEQVLGGYRQLLGEEHPDTLVSAANLAETLRAEGDLAGARSLQEEVLAKFRRVLGEEHRQTLASMADLAETLRAEGDLAGARSLQEEVLAKSRAELGEEDPATLASMANLAGTLHAQGDLAGARMLQEKALRRYRAVLGERHPDTLASMANLAKTLADQNDLEGARLLQEQVLLEGTRVLGETHPFTVEAMRRLGETLKRLGDSQKALDLLSRAFDLQAKKAEPNRTMRAPAGKSI